MNIFKSKIFLISVDYNQEEMDQIMRKELKINDKQKRRNIQSKERQKALMMGKLPKKITKTNKNSTYIY